MTENANPLQRVVDLLAGHGFGKAADDLRSEMQKLSSADPSERLHAVEAIDHMSNPRWLGDLYVEGLTLSSWWGLLGEAADFARQVANVRPAKPRRP